jgi:hypothetical protein
VPSIRRHLADVLQVGITRKRGTHESPLTQPSSRSGFTRPSRNRISSVLPPTQHGLNLGHAGLLVAHGQSRHIPAGELVLAKCILCQRPHPVSAWVRVRPVRPEQTWSWQRCEHASPVVDVVARLSSTCLVS